MPIETVIHDLISTSRIDVRKEVVNKFLEENCGTGNGDNAAKYKYIVESFDKYKIVLQRPAPLNKGFDFIVKVEDIFFGEPGKKRHKNPSHKDIVQTLFQVQRNLSTSQYESVKRVLNEIYELQEPSYNLITDFTFNDYDGNEHPLQVLLLAIKWLFIEQDITYWNYSGRAMLMNGLWEQRLA